MDLSEALKFTPLASFAATPPPSGSSITPAVNRNNRSGCTSTCSNRNHTALFHYSSVLESVSLYDTRSRDIQSTYDTQNVLHVACSNDARIVLLVHTDGSVSCVDVTRSEMKLRWSMENVHSHTSKYGVDQGDNVIRRKRMKANVHRGPVHSVKFQRKGYHALIADAIEGIIVIDCQAGKIVRRISSEGNGVSKESDLGIQPVVRITCADWCGSESDSNDTDDSTGISSSEMMIIGYDDGMIGFVNSENQITKTIVPDLVQREKNDNDEELLPCWSCTHLDYFGEHYIAIGMCRVSVPDGIEDDDCLEHSSDVEVETDEGDDCADHEACLLIYDRSKQQWTELGDVVPFFSIPKFARHVFFTTYLPKQQLLLVACNVTGEIAVVAKNGEEEEEWQVCELQEGNAAMAPVTDDDEFLVPTGVNWIMNGNGKVDFVLSSSDGSMSMFELEHCTDETFGSLGQFKQLELEWTVQDDPVGTVEAVDKDGTKIETQAVKEVAGSLPKVASATTPFSNAKTFLGAQTMTGSSIGGGLGGGAKTVFGQTSSLGFSSSPFGVKSSGDQQKPSLSFGSPTFGLSSAKPGEFSLAPTATNNTVTQELSTIEKSAPIFGSALKETNAFGNISNSLASNELKAASPMGFASLAANAKEKVDFGTTTDTKAPIDIHDTLSKTIDGESGQRGENVRIVKSFSESESSEASIEVHSDTKFSDTGSVVDLNSNELHDQLTKEGQLAARAFDAFDDDKQGKIPIGKLESLLDEIGEGFHGTEFDKQLALLDPSSSGFIDRKSFISWYCHLGEVSDHDGSSLDSDERNEREEEKTKAMNAFDSVAADGVLLHKSEFGKLMEQMGTTYCEEEHVRTVRKISDSNGNISKESFVNWYMDWLFGDGDGDDSEASEGVESDAINDSCKAEAKPEASTKGWGDTFAIDKDSWKCNACMLLNKGSVATCVACQTVRPGHQHVNESGGQPREQTEGDGKFSFSAKGTGDTKGFSFGFTPTPEESKGGGSGFTFGFSSPLEPSATTSKSGLSFGFNSTSNDETSRQNEEIKESSIAVVDEKTTSGSGFPPVAVEVPNLSKKPSSASGFPPMATKAPTPFGSSAVKTTEKPSSASGFPPMATKAPTPFGSSAVKTTEKPSSASGFPPTATKAPTPFGGISGSSSTGICESYTYSSEYESHFWTLFTDWENSLKDMITFSQNLNPKEGLNCDQRGYNLIEELSFNFNILYDQSHNLKESSLLLLSLRDDLDRQIEESKEIISVHFEEDNNVACKLSKWRSLDTESEKKRRHLINRCLTSQKYLARLREKIGLLQALVKKPPSVKNSFLPWTPLRIKRFPADKVTTKLVLESLKAGYDRTKTLEDKASMLQGNVTKIMNESTEDYSFQSVPATMRGKYRVNAISLLSPTSLAKSVPPSSLSVLSALQSLNKTYKVSPKRHLCGNSDFDFDRAMPSAKSPSWRANARSNVMNVSSSTDAPSFQSRSQIIGGIPLKKGQLRPEWYNSDTKGMEHTKLELPRSLKLLDASKAEQQALAPFGVTPEKLSSMKVTIEKGYSKKESTPSAVGKGTSSRLGETTFQSKPVSSGKEQPRLKISPSVNKSDESKLASSNASVVLSSTSTFQVAKEKEEDNRKTPSVSQKSDDKSHTASETNIFSGMKEIKKSLDISDLKPASPKVFSSQSFLGARDSRNYEHILTNFYKAYNASKLNEVQKTLEKYKGNESALFEKLSRKYNVPNPLETDVTPSSGTESITRSLGGPSQPSQSDIAKSGGSTFGVTAASLKTKDLTSTVAPFGVTPMTSFSASAATATNSPFGSASSSKPGGFGTSPSSPFGQNSSTSSSFGKLSQPMASPFGQSSSPTVSSFGTLAGPGGRTFGGKTAREILIAFYQQRNPSKVSEVDKLLAKYAGNEEQLLRNLAKKYSLDPSYFGLSSTSVPVFGSASIVGQSQPFGQTNQSSSGSAAFGTTGFGSLAQSVQGNTGGFGSLQSTQTANTFGSSASPFGAPRR